MFCFSTLQTCPEKVHAKFEVILRIHNGPKKCQTDFLLSVKHLNWGDWLYEKFPLLQDKMFWLSTLQKCPEKVSAKFEVILKIHNGPKKCQTDFLLRVKHLNWGDWLYKKISLLQDKILLFDILQTCPEKVHAKFEVILRIHNGPKKCQTDFLLHVKQLNWGDWLYRKFTLLQDKMFCFSSVTRTTE